MIRSDPEIDTLRDKVHCGVILERTPPPWRLDRRESTKACLKYRRGKGEILIVNHGGRGWWDPTSDARGDVFDLVQRFDPSLNFGQVRKVLRAFAGVSPAFHLAERRRETFAASMPVAERYARRPRLRRRSAVWRYLANERCLPPVVLEAAASADVLREGPYASAWFAHHDGECVVTHVDVRGPTYKGSLTGGAKTLFRLASDPSWLSRLVLAEAPIDALSLAALERLEPGTLYAATGGGMGPGTIAALEGLLAAMAQLSHPILCSAADANAAGERFAAQHNALTAKAGVAFARLRSPIEGGDWNGALKQRIQGKA